MKVHSANYIFASQVAQRYNFSFSLPTSEIVQNCYTLTEEEYTELKNQVQALYSFIYAQPKSEVRRNDLIKLQLKHSPLHK